MSEYNEYKITNKDGHRIVRFAADVDAEYAYAITQCDDALQDADILIVPAAGIVGFIYDTAWPVAIKGDGGWGGLKDRDDFIADQPDYADVLRYCEGLPVPRKPRSRV